MRNNFHTFVEWVTKQGWEDPHNWPPYLERRRGPLWVIEVLYRDEPFQVELVRVAKGTIATHRHPGIDSCEYFISGQGILRVGHRSLELRHEVCRAKQIIPIPESVWHGGNVGDDGVSFLSIQRWKNGLKQSSVAEVWEGSQNKVVM